MSVITRELAEKAGDAFTRSWMTRIDPSGHWQHEDMIAALNAVLPDILEAAAQVADDATKTVTICCDCEEDCVRIATAIRALAEDTGTVQSRELLKKEAKQ